MMRWLFGAMLAAAVVPAQARGAALTHTGDPRDVSPATQPLVCLAGGGDDDLWAEGWKRMLLASGGGDVVVIRADGSRGGYEPWIFADTGKNGFPRVDSVTTVSLSGRQDAERRAVAKRVRDAEMVFFAGGDQSDYLRFIKGTPLEDALEHALHVRKVPFGGTSAGMAILGGIDYAARHSSPADGHSLVKSADVLADPSGRFVDLDRGLLTAPLLKRVVTDTHFSQRDRQGRLFGFMARAASSGWAGVDALSVRGIAADEGTAVCYDSLGTARVHGAGSAYFLAGRAPIERLEPGRPLVWNAGGRAVEAYRIDGKRDAGAAFDLRSWTGSGGHPGRWSVDGSGPGGPVLVVREEAP